MRVLTQEEKDDILGRMDSQGLDYYLENYAKGDFANTDLESALIEFLAAREKMNGSLINAGLDIDSY